MSLEAERSCEVCLECVSGVTEAKEEYYHCPILDDGKSAEDCTDVDPVERAKDCLHYTLDEGWLNG